MNRVSIDNFLQNNNIVIDVRSPMEYNHAHLPGAINIPLFNDEERKIVGTAYKQQSREIAIKIGLDIFGPKMRSIVEQVEDLVSFVRVENGNDKIESCEEGSFSLTHNSQLPTPNFPIAIYCARGGMRSAAMAWLLNLYGFNITTCVGGYKAFRNWVLQQFTITYNFQLLSGNTGSGKTKIILQKNNFIDIEGLAHHKGSAFGNIGMPVQLGQEMFENKFAIALSKVNKNEPIWLEDESQRLGTNIIPQGIWKQMRVAQIELLELPFAQRLQSIINEYGVLPKENLATAIERIQKRLGGLETKNALQFLADDDIENCFTILLQYYDKQYKKGLDKRKNGEMY
jgi:tRNA 2-selenouridine synthase